MSDGARSVGLWPRIPATVLGLEVPRRFRSVSARFRDPDRVLVDFMGWLEQNSPTSADDPPRLRTEPAPDVPTPGEDSQPLADRRALLETLIATVDRFDDPTLRQRLVRAMESAGVEPIVADGERFDPRHHDQLDEEATDDPAKDGIVASTPRPGYSDRGRVIRPPEVVVYSTRRPG
jgi:molecular chaperone GrpE